MAEQCSSFPARAFPLYVLVRSSQKRQQASRLCPLVHELLSNRVFLFLDEWKDVQAERCRWLYAHPPEALLQPVFSEK